MPDQSFESILSPDLRRYAEGGVRPINRHEIARSVIAAGTVTDGRRAPRWPWDGLRQTRPPLLRPLAVALGLVGLLILATLAILAGLGGRSQLLVTVPSPSVTVSPVASRYVGKFARLGPVDEGVPTEALVELQDGRVLSLGGSWPDRVSQAIWDPATGQFSAIGQLIGKRSQPIAIPLADGRVLILGGDTTEPVCDPDCQGAVTYSTAELYDPETGTFTSAGPMVGKGFAPSAIRLADGRVLVLDGISVDEANGPDPLLATAEIYDPATDTFTATGSMSIGRGPEALVLLHDGRVLVVGGTMAEPDAAELYDSETGQFTPVGPMPEAGPHPEGGSYWPDVPAAAVTLQDGRALIAGRRCMEVHTLLPDGHSEGWFPTAAAIFDPNAGAFSPITPMPHCVSTATALPDGEVLVTGWWYEATGEADRRDREVDWSGLYDPRSDTMRETAGPHGGPYIDLVGLSDGRVLVIGFRGDERPVEDRVAEVFH